MIKSDNFTIQAIGTAWVLALSKAFPPAIGHPVASVISWVLGNRILDPIYLAVRTNQWVANQEDLTARQLRKAIRRVYQNQGRALYDFYHNLDRPDEIKKIVKISPRFQTMMEECKSGELNQGTLLLMPHLSGFNLGGLLLANMGFKFLTLAVPNPNRGYVWQNKLRNERGMEVEPMTMSSMQTARKRLQEGGVVLTGVDRPHEISEYAPKFFGRPAPLPVAYIKLALRTHARVFVVGFRTLIDKTCLIDLSDQVIMQEHPDPHQELILNAQKVLHLAEEFIKLDPTQWMMFLPVWPHLEREIPIL